MIPFERFDSADLSPMAPHDDVDFNDLARSYSFHLISNTKRVFTRLVIKEAHARSAPVRALDIGCGRGLGRVPEFTKAISSSVTELWGIEPDASVTPPQGVFSHFEHALMETAQLPKGHFDLAYSFMVMEHVADPEAFMRAVSRALKPGGVYLFMTPNGRSYFTRVAKALHRLSLEEGLLRVLRPGIKDSYHYPVQYRFNVPSDIEALVRSIGFDRPEFAFVEGHGARGYFPGPLGPLYKLLVLKRRWFKNPEALVTLVGKIKKSAAG